MCCLISTFEIGMFKKIRSFLTALFKKLLFISACVGLGWFFQLGAEINGKDIPEEYFYSGGYPVPIALMDAEWFIGFASVLTLLMVVYLLKLAWELHEIAVHKAEKTMAAHVTLVSALTMLGLFIDNTWWILAIIIAFTNWSALGESIVRLSKKVKEETQS
ncbi:Magnesium transporter [Vibrio chagasii]|nr:Magnesium transporter [Vibrio chagasii]CAH7456791.1 Magnesium transporter [Vibrio chagasii]